MHWDEIVPILSLSNLRALLTPVIAVAAVYIAYQQWMTNRRRLKLELYQRRFRLYETTRDLLVVMYTGSADDRRQFQLLNQMNEREFLFRGKIKDYLDDVWRHASNQFDARQQLATINETVPDPTERRQELTQIESREVKWAFEETLSLATKFKKYLDVRKL